MFCNEDVTDTQGCILHTQRIGLDHIGMMSLLDTLGYPRAVILGDEPFECGLHRVSCCNNMPIQAIMERPVKERTPWPQRDIHHWTSQPLFLVDMPSTRRGQHTVQTGFNSQDLQELLAASDTFLHTEFTGLDLPEFVKDAVCQPRQHQEYDRWLIYTDGSSQTSMRRIAPQQADEQGMPDTWAMLVLGEKFTDDGSSIVEPIGWCTHPVRYDEDGTCFTGAKRIGAEVAERDALIWAGLWRIAQNSNIPTVYCCDSLTSGKQAFGLIGTGSTDLSFRLLRGLYQGLEHGLPPGHLRLHHVKSHAGDPYNEFVDLVAKREAQQSFHHRRPKLNMQKWNKIIPHLWLTFAQPCGLPEWCDGELETVRPDLPPQEPQLPDEAPAVGHYQHFKCTLSMASANVMSLSRKPDGCGGKLHFLYAQMKQFGINVMGVQEGRADECTTTSGDVLRITGGHHHRNGGVELWINLKQPVAHNEEGEAIYFAKDQCQVVHCDPRRLLVKMNHRLLNCWFFVGHGPHSGRSQDERSEWWQQTTDLLAAYIDDDPCFWLLDANAAPGAADNQVVYQPGLKNQSTQQNFVRPLRSSTCVCPPLHAYIRAHVTPGPLSMDTLPTVLTMLRFLPHGYPLASGRRFSKTLTWPPLEMIIKS